LKFILSLQKLQELKKFENIKELSETAIIQQKYGEVPQDGRLFLLCGNANFHLGYLLIAE
jgi:hypothetical protein